jgi:hypothetical protein
MKKIYGFIIAAILLSGFQDAFSQMNHKLIKKNNRRLSSFRGKKFSFGKEKQYFSLGFSLNALNYYGDLAPKPGRFSTDISFTRPAVGLSISHRFGPRYSLTAGLMYGTLRGSDNASADENDLSNGKFRYQRNLSFRNRIEELSVVATFDLFENEATYISRAKWTPYAFIGVSAFHHNPQTLAPAQGLDGQPLEEAGQWVSLQELGTEGQYAELLPTDVNYGIKPYKLIQVAIPFGVGARFKLNEVFDIAGELGFRYLFTDYIDDVSQNYVDLGVFDNELARALSYRGNELTKADIARFPETARNGVTYDLISGYGKEYPPNMRGGKNAKDIFMVTTFRLTYILGKSFHRAKFR